MSILIPKNKKAQGWGLDVFFAITIFVAGAIILYIYAINYTSQTNDKLDEMKYEANLASELILSEETFGILSNGKINETKMDEFNISYEERKAFFGLVHDFYFLVDEDTTTTIGEKPTAQTSDLVKITRIVVYQNKITKMEVFVWDE